MHKEAFTTEIVDAIMILSSYRLDLKVAYAFADLVVWTRRATCRFD